MLLTLLEQIIASFFNASCGKSGQDTVQCECSRQILQVWMYKDRRIENEECVFSLVSIDRVVFAAIARDMHDL